MEKIILENTDVTYCRVENTSKMTDKQLAAAGVMCNYIMSLHNFATICDVDVSSEQIKICYYLKKHELRIALQHIPQDSYKSFIIKPKYYL